MSATCTPCCRHTASNAAAEPVMEAVWLNAAWTAASDRPTFNMTIGLSSIARPFGGSHEALGVFHGLGECDHHADLGSLDHVEDGGGDADVGFVARRHDPAAAEVLEPRTTHDEVGKSSALRDHRSWTRTAGCRARESNARSSRSRGRAGSGSPCSSARTPGSRWCARRRPVVAAVRAGPIPRNRSRGPAWHESRAR